MFNHRSTPKAHPLRLVLFVLKLPFRWPQAEVWLRVTWFLLTCTSLFLAPPVNAQSAASPAQRQVTDPQLVVSVANPAARPLPIEDLYFTRSVFSPAWSPDGQQVVFTTDLSGRFNLWKGTASGGWPVQLTQSDDLQFNAVWSPDGQWIVYQQDRAGNELYDLYAVPSDGGEIVNLTNTPDIREEYPRWSPDGKVLAIMYKPQHAPLYDIALLDWPTRQVRKLTNEESTNYGWSAVAWSPDGKTLYANRMEISSRDAEIYSIVVASGERENLTPHQGAVWYVASSLAPDGKTLLITSTEKDGYRNVALLDVASKQRTWVTDVQWEANAGDFSPDGNRLTYVMNADGRTEAYLVEGKSGRRETVAVVAGWNDFAGNPTTFSPQGDRLLVSHQSATQPADLWVYELADRRVQQLTFSSIASLRGTPLPSSQIVHYKSFDGQLISALLWMPFNLKRDDSNPALVLPHGGPTGQTVDYWNPDVTALVSRGYICIAPNFRGSTGYGLTFQKANYQDLGGGDLQDVVSATHFLRNTGYVDPKKVGITGGSYGGFMTLMALGKTPDHWAAAVELYGIIDWYTMLKHADPLLQEYVKSLLGDPARDRQVYEAASPIQYLHQATAPLLVLQGETDVRVPKEEAEQVVTLLKKAGKVVDVHYYPNEGHGFYKRENRIDATRRTVAWFERYLKSKN